MEHISPGTLPKDVSSVNGPDSLVTLYGTVSNGLEGLLGDEIEERLKGIVRTVTRHKGRVFFTLPGSKTKEALSLRLVDHLYVVVAHLPENLPENTLTDDLLQHIIALPATLPWSQAVDVWKIFHPTEIGGEGHEDALPAFRVSPHRLGKHPEGFTSIAAGGALGYGIHNANQWRVDLSHPDIDVHLNIIERDMWVSLRLTKEALYKRHVVAFGPTTLRSTLCYAMLHLAKAKDGDVVVDPMCGGGSINIETAICVPSTYNVMGDSNMLGIQRCKLNTAAVEAESFKQGPMDIVQWDVTSLPLRNDTVDIILTDLPFGKKIGNRKENLALYSKALKEMARVCQSNGRAVLLTQDKKNLDQALLTNEEWEMREILTMSMGGLQVGIYVLDRRTQGP